jgi:branched-chain amino acid transport system substrate-binding protein
MQTNKRPLLLLIIFFLCQPAFAQDTAIKIGAISVLSGEGASWGVNHQRASLLAAEEFNASSSSNGKQIEIIFEDSPSGIGRNAVAAYLKLTQIDKVKFILGPVMMDELLAVAPLARRDEVFISAATYMPNPPDNVFTTWIDADIESDLMANHVFKHYQRVAVLSSQQSWEAQVAHRFKATFLGLGGKITSFQEPLFDAVQVKTEVLKLKQSKPNAIFISSYYLLPKYLKELRRLKITLPIFSIELDQAIIDNSSGAAESLVFIAPSAPESNFVEKFKKRWKANPDIPAASAYDAAMLLFSAISNGNGEIGSVVDFFRQLQGYRGVTGQISKLNNKTSVSTSYYIVKAGKISTLN